MKIQLIGTGTIPDMTNSASVLINDHILFDVPNGNLKAMIRQNKENNVKTSTTNTKKTFKKYKAQTPKQFRKNKHT